jgi:Transposase DDE domain/Transposase domain (DUF772)
VRSSRAIERRCVDDVAFRFLCAGQGPDFRSIARFRRRHLPALAGLLLQSLELAQRMGLVKLGRVALDGTKLRASASRHKAMSYDRLCEKEAAVAAEIAELKLQIERMLTEAEAVDAAEDARLGQHGRDVDLPGELARREVRLDRMRQAKAALEAEAAERARRQAEQRERDRQRRRDDGAGGDAPTPERAAAASDGQAQNHPGVPQVERDPDADRDGPGAGPSGPAVDEAAVLLAGQRAAEATVPKPKAQRNFTDGDSRIMKNSDGAFIQAYNGQAVVDSEHQIIVAADVTTCAADYASLTPMLDAAQANAGRTIGQVLVDAGYCSADNLAAAAARHAEHGTETFMATGRLKHGERVPPQPRGRIPQSATPRERMARKLRTKAGRAAYARRKVIVEPVFGQMATLQDGKRLLLRGIDGARGEWQLLAACHNLRKIFGQVGSTATLVPALG